MKRRVVITGMGVVSPLGHEIPEFLENLKKGYNGIGPMTRYDVTDRGAKLAAEVRDFDAADYLGRREVKRMDRFTQYGVVASMKAFEDAALNEEIVKDNDRVAIFMSSGIGGTETLQEEIIRGYTKDYDRISPFFVPKVISNMAAAQASIALGIHGASMCPVSACAGGNNAIGDAYRSIKDGYNDIILAGGTEASLVETPVGGFTSMTALCTATDPDRASIPFDKERSGFVMGEGAAMLVLEDYYHAMARGAKVYAEVVGYGITSDAFHITSPVEDGKWASKAMLNAIEDAGIEPKDISSINAHGTSTPMNDKVETTAIKRTFGEYATQIPVNSTKSMTGHLLGAAAALEGVVCALQLKEGFIAPTINYRVPDEECDLNIVANEMVEADLEYVLSDSLGFGGHNIVVVFKKFSE